MNSVFISGIPASGKTYLAKKLSIEVGLPIISIDEIKVKMSEDRRLKKWVDFYLNLDEEEYYNNTSCLEQWKNLTNQSEAFWSVVRKKIDNKMMEDAYIFEGVNLLPHLISELSLDGVYLVGESEQVIFDRIKKNPRWGETEVLQRTEVDEYFHCQGSWYRKEAEKHGFKVFKSADAAYDSLVQLIKEK